MSVIKFSELLSLQLVPEAHAQSVCSQCATATDPTTKRYCDVYCPGGRPVGGSSKVGGGNSGLPLNIKISAPPGTEKFDNIGTLISQGIGAAIIIAAVLALIYLVWGGISWITSGGDKTALEGARGRITNAIVGLIVVVAAYAIFVLVTEFVGIKGIVGN